MKNSKIILKTQNFFNKYPREYYVFAFFALFLLSIIIELFSFTVYNKSYYKGLADSQQISELRIPSTRGSIYSSNNEGRVLATSVDLNDLAIDPSVDGDKNRLTDFLTEIVYNEICHLKSLSDCRSGLFRFLGVRQLNDFTMHDGYLKEKIRERIWTRVNRERVTSVLIRNNLTNIESFDIDRLNLSGVSVNGNYLYVNPEALGDTRFVAERLVEILGGDIDSMEYSIRKRPLRYVVIFNKLSISGTESIRKRLKEEKEAIKNGILSREESIGRFLILSPRGHRLYPENKMAAQVIGFVDSSGVGRYGIEGYFDNILKGRPGDNNSRTDIHGRVIEPLSLNSDSSSIPGANITTTIDRNIQKGIEDILDKDVFEYGANNISVVVMDPRDGRVISMATHPRFDLNNPGEAYQLIRVTPESYPNPSINLRGARVMAVDNRNGEEFFYNGEKIFLREAIYEEFDDWGVEKYFFANRQGAGVYRNHIIQDIYEPGSIFKPILMAAGIDSGEIGRFDMYQDDGFVKIDQFTIRNVDNRCLGYHSFNHAMNYSCNVGMIRIAQRLGRALYHRYLENFGFGQKTGITLDGEVSGRLDPYERWSTAQLLTSSYGLGIGVNMLQIAQAYGALANGGILYRPHIVEKIEFFDDREVLTKSEPIRRVISEETSRIVTDVLVDGVDNALAKNGGVTGYSIAGKTGTAQIAARGTYETGPASTTASYAGFGPAEDPRFVIVVKVERPRANPYGSMTAAPTFSRIAEFLMDYYKIPPNN